MSFTLQSWRLVVVLHNSIQPMFLSSCLYIRAIRDVGFKHMLHWIYANQLTLELRGFPPTLNCVVFTALFAYSIELTPWIEPNELCISMTLECWKSTQCNYNASELCWLCYPGWLYLKRSQNDWNSVFAVRVMGKLDWSANDEEQATVELVDYNSPSLHGEGICYTLVFRYLIFGANLFTRLSTRNSIVLCFVQ